MSSNRRRPGISGMNLAISATPFSSTVLIPGRIEDFTPGEVSVVLEQPIPVGHSVTVNFRGAIFNGEVLYCREQEAGYHINLRLLDSAASGLRSTPRFTVKLAAHVFAQSAGEIIAATIIDISGAGLGLELPSPVSVG